jgi:NAD(P)-dependent dehydrogenase (short-subunit alcohol dehydrogenase family)
MLLENKTAVVYGGGGSIGGAMARGFAAEGARCVLVGRTPETLDAAAGKIRADGGQAETAVVDVLDEAAVSDHADSVAETAGSLDISVNVVSQDTIFRPLADIPVDDFAAAMDKVVRSQLNTTKAAARHMVRQQSGVILFFGGADYVSRKDRANMGTVQVGMDIVEALRRQWASELGPHGVRLLTMLTGGIAESFGDVPEMAEAKQALIDQTLLGRAASFDDVGRVAAFLASDHARCMTATQVNISCGAIGE